MISPVAWLTDDEFTNLKIRERALVIMSTYVGEEESPKNSNWGKFVQGLLRVAGIYRPAPWCAAFIFFCLIRAGYPRDQLPKGPASTWNWIEWAREKHYTVPLYEADRTDLIVWNSKGKGHIFAVTESFSKFVKSIEGNGNLDGSREGNEVVRHERKFIDLIQMKNITVIRLPL